MSHIVISPFYIDGLLHVILLDSWDRCYGRMPKYCKAISSQDMITSELELFSLKVTVQSETWSDKSL
jgi:hypothetical protein